MTQLVIVDQIPHMPSPHAVKGMNASVLRKNTLAWFILVSRNATLKNWRHQFVDPTPMWRTLDSKGGMFAQRMPGALPLYEASYL